ncbi:ABC transporter substrate-binding protein [Microbacterium resistens]|uniref:ABC transporter substrate-binding protein n=1 Tax=Microbacterium resistens TaxID=156977 RepID=UPI001C575D4A|nr:ABC transporter substrate-binding protein [Microbacterium resistens]MBW1639418.1 ABC transporter substrate-binding protein [Microbacterium resistens]
MRRSILAMLATASLVVVAGCTTTPAESSSDGVVALAGEARNDGKTCDASRIGGAVTFGAHTDGPGLDPVAPQANLGMMQQAAVYGTLMRYDYDRAAYEPDVAESLVASDDNAEWTLTLRDGVRFGDGTPLTAAAVKSHIERFSDPANPSNFSPMIAQIAAMQVRDDRTLVFTLAKPWGTFPFLLSEQPGMIVNPAVIDEIGPEQLALQPPPAAGVGAFEVTRYQANDSLVLTAKDDWWGGPVCIQDLTITVTVDGQTKLDSFKAGQNQGFLAFDAAVSKRIDEDGLRYTTLGNPLVGAVQMNAAEGRPLADPRLRTAIQVGMDLDSLNERIYQGVGVPTAAIIDPASALAPDVEPLTFDAEHAADLVAEAGGDAAFTYSLTAAPMQIEESILQEAFWENAGFSVTRQEQQNSDLVTAVYADRNYDAALWAMSTDLACVWCALDAFRSDSPANTTSFADPEFDAALEDLRAAGTPAEIRAAMNTVQEIWNAAVPIAVKGHLKWVVALDENLHGVRYGAGQIISFDRAYLGE